MTILLNCTNKGCFKRDYHELDVESGQVICVECQGIVAATPQMKSILKTQKQIKQPVKQLVGIKCAFCESLEPPAILKFGKKLKVGCPDCHTVNQHLTRYFLPIYKEKMDVKVITIPVSPDGTPLPKMDTVKKGGVVITSPSQGVVEMLPEFGDDDAVGGGETRPKIKTSIK